MSFTNRGNALIELLEELNEGEFQYVLVSGYAVATFNARFSTDLDIVIAPDSEDAIAAFLEERGFEETGSHAKDWFYDTEVIEYGKTPRSAGTDWIRSSGERSRVSSDRSSVAVWLSP